jgi:K+-transporting ATPase ATPase C chain
MPLEKLRALVRDHTAGRQFGLGEPTVNVLLLNVELDQQYPSKSEPCGPQ